MSRWQTLFSLTRRVPGDPASSSLGPLCASGVLLHHAEDLVSEHRHVRLFAASRLGKCCAGGVSQPMEVLVGNPNCIEGGAEVLAEGGLVDVLINNEEQCIPR